MATEGLSHHHHLDHWRVGGAETVPKNRVWQAGTTKGHDGACEPSELAAWARTVRGPAGGLRPGHQDQAWVLCCSEASQVSRQLPPEAVNP